MVDSISPKGHNLRTVGLTGAHQLNSMFNFDVSCRQLVNNLCPATEEVPHPRLTINGPLKDNDLREGGEAKQQGLEECGIRNERHKKWRRHREGREMERRLEDRWSQEEASALLKGRSSLEPDSLIWSSLVGRVSMEFLPFL